MADAVLAGVRLEAEWVVPPAQPGDLVNVEFDIDDMLGWGDTIAMAGAESTLHEGPRVRGTVEGHEQQLLTIRIAGRTAAGRAPRRPRRHSARHGSSRSGRASQAVPHGHMSPDETIDLDSLRVASCVTALAQGLRRSP
ncbi:hypothetical protein [Micromonospora craterilacus]|uniref:hypothetical protein n=1 Tax=Micromonospora craterilacus TaxID=1655439 RepID=UPI0011B6DC56|nr:hypothetical protein [Micromonospora craterilacus]